MGMQFGGEFLGKFVAECGFVCIVNCNAGWIRMIPNTIESVSGLYSNLSFFLSTAMDATWKAELWGKPKFGWFDFSI